MHIKHIAQHETALIPDTRCVLVGVEHLKTAWHRKREKELMEKLVEIVNDRNAIVEGLDEDRIRCVYN